VPPVPDLVDVIRDRMDEALRAAGGTADFADLCGYLSQVCTTGIAPRSLPGGPGDSVGPVLEALSGLRRQTTPGAVIDNAPRELCGTGLFDRVLISRVRGSTWFPQTFFYGGPDAAPVQGNDGYLAALAIPLTSPLLEAEVVRRRLPALVSDADSEARAYRPLIERTGATEYVVAPVVAGATVVGLLHADCRVSGRPLTVIDRDLLRLFADGVGLIYDRADLADRVAQQQESIARACDAAAESLMVIDADSAGRFAGQATYSAVAVNRARVCRPGQSGPLAQLTAREREVLALLASGATNAQLADQLTVAECTVKSHIKRILHKLGAGNRAGAIACYMRETRADERGPRWE
jgi:DNA-binding CsgD family transcriptional regulator/GAF domain-containing protein